MPTTNQKFVYVLELDDSNLAKGIKRVSKELVDIDANIQVLQTELRKANANQLTKSIETANTATTKQVKAVKDLNAELDKSASYAAKSKGSFNIAGDVEKQLNALKRLQQEFLKTTKFPANAEEFWKAPLDNARKFRQEATFEKLIKDSEKYRDALLRLSSIYDTLAKRDLSFKKAIEARMLDDASRYKYSYLNTTPSKFKLGDLEFGSQKGLDAYKKQLDEALKLTEQYNAKKAQELRNRQQQFLKEQKQFLDAENKAVAGAVNKELALRKQAAAESAKRSAEWSKVGTSFDKNIANLTKSLNAVREAENKQFQADWNAQGKAVWDNIKKQGEASKALANEIKQIDADLAKKAKEEADKRIKIAQDESLKLAGIIKARNELNQKFMYGITPTTKLTASDFPQLANIVQTQAARAKEEAEWKQHWDNLGKANWENIQKQAKDVQKRNEELRQIDANLTKQTQEESIKRIKIAQTESLKLNEINRLRNEQQQKFMFGITPTTGLKATDFPNLTSLAAQQQAAIQAEVALRKAREQAAQAANASITARIMPPLANKTYTEATLDKISKLWEAQEKQQTALVKKEEAERLAVRQKAAKDYEKAMTASDDYLKALWKQQQVAAKAAAKTYAKEMATQGEVLKNLFQQQQTQIVKKWANTALSFNTSVKAQTQSLNAQAQAVQKIYANVIPNISTLGKSAIVAGTTSQNQQLVANMFTNISGLGQAGIAGSQNAQAAQLQQFQSQFAAFSQLSNQVNASLQLQQANLINNVNALRNAATAAQTATNTQQALQQALTVTSQQASRYYQAFLTIKGVLVDFRTGLDKVQLATLDMARTIQQEIAARERNRAEYAKLTPEMLKLIDIRQREKQLVKEIEAEYSKYQQAQAAAMQAGKLGQAMAETAAWNTYISKRLNDQRQLTQEEIKATKELEKQAALLERLQKASNGRVTKAQGTFQQSGQFAYLQGSGASDASIKVVQLQTIISKTQAAYEKLVERTRQGLFNAKDAAEVAKINAEFDKTSARLTNLSTKYNSLLGTVEKLAGAHKPLIERIFDFVVGYRLINAALNTFTNAIRSVPEAGLQFETTYASLKAVYSVTAKVNEELKFLDKLAQDAGISVGDLRTSFTDFAASAKFSGEETKNIEEIFSNISKAGMVLHLPADRMKSAFTAINQMYAKNQVMMEELKRQLGNQLPAAVNIFALSMGKTTRQLMDDMKKGLVLPKETILEFSRTYASIFASPDAVEYASQGVNAYFQRLSTAWTNFSTKIYEVSKGGIKTGLGIFTEVLKFATENAEKLKDATLLLGTVIGISMVQHLAKATMAWVAYRNSVVAATSVSLAGSALNAKNMTSVMSGAAAGAAAGGMGASLATFAKNTWAIIPPWVKLIGLIGGAIVSLKDLEVNTVKVMSSADKLDGKAVEVMQSVTVSDVVLASWDLLAEKINKAASEFADWYVKNSNATPDVPKIPNLSKGSIADTIGYSNPIFAPLYASGKRLYEAGTAKAEQQKVLDNAAEEAKRQSEFITERVKETLLQGTSGVVTETMDGVSRTVTTALNRISAEFDATKQRIEGGASREISKANLEIAKIQSAERIGSITALESKKKQWEIQKRIWDLQLDVLRKEEKALEDKARKEEAISEARLKTSKEATAYEAAYLTLGTKQRFLAEIPKVIQQQNPNTYQDVQAATLALQTGKVGSDVLQKAFDTFNATHLEGRFTKLENVTKETLDQANRATVEAWKKYEEKITEHQTTIAQVANGIDLKAEGRQNQHLEVLKQIAENTKPTTQTPEDFLKKSYGQQTGLVGGVVDKFISDKYQSGSKLEQDLQRAYQTTNERWGKAIGMFATKYSNVPAELVKSVIAVESAGNPNARSGAGAVGLGQFMPDTATRFGVTDRTNAMQSIEGTFKYLDFLLKKFGGSVELAVAGYNAGENRKSLEAGRIPNIPETQDYVKKIATLYTPSKTAVQTGVVKSEEATNKTLLELEKTRTDSLNKLDEKTADTIGKTDEQMLLAFETAKNNLQSLYNLTKTERDKALSTLDNTPFQLSEAERQTRTTTINRQYLPQLTKELDDLANNLKEELLRTAETSKKNSIQAELINLTKERQTLMADVAKGEFEEGLRKVIPMQDALERKHFEVKKQLQDTLGIYDETLTKQEQSLRSEELIKFIYTEQAKLKEKSLGYSKEEIANRQQLLNQLTEYQNKLNQIDLINAKIAKDSAYTSALEGVAQAAGANTPEGIVAQAGLGGRFAGAMVAEVTAKQRYQQQLAAYQTEMGNFKTAQALQPAGSTEWEKYQAQIETTTTKMNALKLAKDAVFVQAGTETIDSVSNAFVDWANGAKTASEALRGVAIDFLKMIQDILMQEVKVQLIRGMFSLFGMGVGGFASGGLVRGYASGGQVNGKGTGISDSNYAVVPNGSYVLNAQATHQAKQNQLIKVSHGEVILTPEQVAQIGVDKLNKINARGYASGGLVGASVSSSKPANMNNSNVTNINVSVPEGTTNAKQFGQEVGVEIMKAIAKQEASKQVNLYAKRAANQ